MCSDKTYVNHVRKEYHHYNHPEIVTPNVEHISVITNEVHMVEVIPDICKTFPISFRYLYVPVTQRFLGICMVFDIVPYGRIR